MAYFKDELERAITSNELHTFRDVLPLYTALTETSTLLRKNQDRGRDRDRD